METVTLPLFPVGCGVNYVTVVNSLCVSMDIIPLHLLWTDNEIKKKDVVSISLPLT
jgi:hypothetical protein